MTLVAAKGHGLLRFCSRPGFADQQGVDSGTSFVEEKLQLGKFVVEASGIEVEQFETVVVLELEVVDRADSCCAWLGGQLEVRIIS